MLRSERMRKLVQALEESERRLQEANDVINAHQPTPFGHPDPGYERLAAICRDAHQSVLRDKERLRLARLYGHYLGP